jgi:endonuclease-3
MISKIESQKVLAILRKEYDNTSTALTFQTPFQLLISTILSAQSTDKQVNKITQELYRDFPDANSFLKLTQEKLEVKIKSIGLFRSKAHSILQTCKVLVEKFQGEVPGSRDELIKLPGVGRKTANVVLSVGFNHDAIAVDTHVFRVSNRIGLANASNVEKTEQQLMQNIPQSDWSAAHHWLIWHGRIICKAQNPNCNGCSLKKYCLYYDRLQKKNNGP